MPYCKDFKIVWWASSCQHLYGLPGFWLTVVFQALTLLWKLHLTWNLSLTTLTGASPGEDPASKLQIIYFLYLKGCLPAQRSYQVVEGRQSGRAWCCILCWRWQHILQRALWGNPCHQECLCSTSRSGGWSHGWTTKSQWRWSKGKLEKVQVISTTVKICQISPGVQMNCLSGDWLGSCMGQEPAICHRHGRLCSCPPPPSLKAICTLPHTGFNLNHPFRILT